jgi:hypothetical protein
MISYFLIALTLVLVVESRARMSYKTLSRTRHLTTRFYPRRTFESGGSQLAF